MEFAIVGQLVKSSKEIRSTIEAMGGKIIYMLNTKTAAVISNAEEVEKDEIDMKFQIKQAKMMGIQVVSEDFIEAVKNDDPYAVINDKNMAQWICNDVCYDDIFSIHFSLHLVCKLIIVSFFFSNSRVVESL